MEQEPYEVEKNSKERCKDDSRSIAKALLVYTLLTFVVSFLITSLIASQDVTSLFTNYTNIVNIVSILTSILVIGWIVHHYKRRLQVDIPIDHNGSWTFLDIVKYTVIGMGLTFIASMCIQLLNYFLQGIGWQMNTPDFSMGKDFVSNLLLVISTCIVAPIFEELLFRGLILQTLKRYGYVFAIVVTSLLFALLHGNIPQTVPIFFFSLVLCYAALKYDSILPAMAIHFLNNSIGMIEGYFVHQDTVLMLLVILELGMAVFAILYLFYKRVSIQTYIRHNKGCRISLFFKNWAAIVFVILYGVMILFTFTMM